MVDEDERDGRRPADAYFEVSRHLVPEFFSSPPPKQGMELVIHGPDGVPTHWWVDFATAIGLKILVNHSPILTLTRETPYLDRERSTPQ